MNIEIEFAGFTTGYDFFQERRHSYTFSGNTLWELIENIIEGHGERIRESLVDKRTQALNPTIEIAINGKIVRDNLHHQIIKEGDKVAFLKILAGG